MVHRANLDLPIFVHFADAYRKEGLLDDAIRLCRTGLEAHASCTSGRLVLAKALFERGDLGAAREECGRILENEPAHPETLALLAAVPAEQGPARQRQDGRADPLASATLASLYAAQGHAAAAREIYRKIGLTRPPTEKPPAQEALEELLALREAVRVLRAGELRRG